MPERTRGAGKNGAALMAATARADRDPDETRDLHELIAEVIEDPDRWLDAPNSIFGGKKPRDVFGTELEPMLRDIVRSIKLGVFS